MVNQAGSDAELLLREAAMVLSRFRRQIPDCVQEELGQESVVRVLMARSVSVPLAFVRRVARNLAVDWLRQHRQQESHRGTELRPDRSWQQQVEQQLEVERVRAALSAAPETYRVLLEATFFEEQDLENFISAELLGRGGADDPESWNL